MSPSFDPKDLEQEALLAMWQQSQRFDPARRVPFQAFAYCAVRSAILMACRRRHYRDATHDELKLKHHPVDARPNAEQALLERREEKLRSQRTAYRLQKVEDLMAGLSAADAFLVKRAFIDGASVEMLAELWGVPADRMRRRLKNALRMLRGLTPLCCLTGKILGAILGDRPSSIGPILSWPRPDFLALSGEGRVSALHPLTAIQHHMERTAS